MKKVLILLAIMALAPLAAFADLGIGPAAFFKSPVLLGQEINVDDLNVNQGCFGGVLRYKMGWFQAEGLVLLSAGELTSMNAYLDAGIAVGLDDIISLSLGAGPNFIGNFDRTTPLQAGLNAKAGADLRLGAVSVGLSYMMALNIDNGIRIQTGCGLLGASVLFWL